MTTVKAYMPNYNFGRIVSGKSTHDWIWLDKDEAKGSVVELVIPINEIHAEETSNRTCYKWTPKHI